ncbi:CHAT domain-containing protein [Cryptosporangium sp. NPDC051539]|uniref:CHAT domain-containing protein n=1 Tax=Cryptosporangium sp. NPDC051539 TaxID=3363962 RepID=UPI0037B4C64A
MQTNDSIRLIEGLTRLSDVDLARVLESLERTDPPLAAEDLAARSVCRLLRYERSSDVSDLAGALDDLHAIVRLEQVDYALTLWSIPRQVNGAMNGHAVDVARLQEVLDNSGEDPYDKHSKAGLRAMALAAGALTEDPRHEATAALAEIDRLMAPIPPGNQFVPTIRRLRHMIAMKRASDRREFGVADLTGEFFDDPATFADGPEPGAARIMTLMAQALAAAQRGDTAEAIRLYDELRPLLNRLPADTPGLAHSQGLMQMLDGLLAIHRPGGGAASTLRVAADRSDLLGAGVRPQLRAMQLLARARARYADGVARDDLAAIREAVSLTRDAVERLEPGSPQLADYHGHLGTTLMSLYARRPDQPTLAECTAAFEKAVELAGSAAHSSWASFCLGLFKVYRAAGRSDEARTWGRRGLAGHGWSVLLQSGADNATAASTSAADDAIEIARAFLEVDDTDGAVEILDAGRGLLLHSAAVRTSVPDRLRAQGAEELAAEWEAVGGTPTDVASDLRYQVLTRLAGVDSIDGVAPGGLLSSPSLDEIRAALATLGADALVYLVPQDLIGPGTAVVVPRTEPTFGLRLPLLTQPPAVDDPADLSGWAWSAAMGPLLDAIGGTPRLVLIPSGPLATVPWHAARSPGGDYAVERAILSYAVSARLLCGTTWRATLADDQGGLVIANPTGDLARAGIEAHEVREAFYPRAALLDEDAAPERVLEWLRNGTSGRAALHLSCHAVTGQGGGDASYLSLAGGATLTARAILEAQDVAPVGVVTLSACTTVVPTGAYDEAFSLATAFLVSGARTVFGSLWEVPDGATSLLVYMTHHYLRRERLGPAEALREAQLWMLSPGRAAPEDLPKALARSARNRQRDHVVAWAAFMHLGR